MSSFTPRVVGDPKTMSERLDWIKHFRLMTEERMCNKQKVNNRDSMMMMNMMTNFKADVEWERFRFMVEEFCQDYESSKTLFSGFETKNVIEDQIRKTQDIINKVESQFTNNTNTNTNTTSNHNFVKFPETAEEIKSYKQIMQMKYHHQQQQHHIKKSSTSTTTTSIQPTPTPLIFYDQKTKDKASKEKDGTMKKEEEEQNKERNNNDETHKISNPIVTTRKVHVSLRHAISQDQLENVETMIRNQICQSSSSPTTIPSTNSNSGLNKSPVSVSDPLKSNINLYPSNVSSASSTGDVKLARKRGGLELEPNLNQSPSQLLRRIRSQTDESKYKSPSSSNPRSSTVNVPPLFNPDNNSNTNNNNNATNNDNDPSRCGTMIFDGQILSESLSKEQEEEEREEGGGGGRERFGTMIDTGEDSEEEGKGGESGSEGTRSDISSNQETALTSASGVGGDRGGGGEGGEGGGDAMLPWMKKGVKLSVEEEEHWEQNIRAIQNGLWTDQMSTEVFGKYKPKARKKVEDVWSLYKG